MGNLLVKVGRNIWHFNKPAKVSIRLSKSNVTNGWNFRFVWSCARWKEWRYFSKCNCVCILRSPRFDCALLEQTQSRLRQVPSVQPPLVSSWHVIWNFEFGVFLVSFLVQLNFIIKQSNTILLNAQCNHNIYIKISYKWEIMIKFSLMINLNLNWMVW